MYRSMWYIKHAYGYIYNTYKHIKFSFIIVYRSMLLAIKCRRGTVAYRSCWWYIYFYRIKYCVYVYTCTNMYICVQRVRYIYSRYQPSKASRLSISCITTALWKTTFKASSSELFINIQPRNVWKNHCTIDNIVCDYT